MAISGCPIYDLFLYFIFYSFLSNFRFNLKGRVCLWVALVSRLVVGVTALGEELQVQLAREELLRKNAKRNRS